VRKYKTPMRVNYRQECYKILWFSIPYIFFHITSCFSRCKKNSNWVKSCEEAHEKIPLQIQRFIMWKCYSEIAFSNGHPFAISSSKTRPSERNSVKSFERNFYIFTLFSSVNRKIKRITEHGEEGEIVILRHELLDLLFLALSKFPETLSYLWEFLTAVANFLSFCLQRNLN
jgi:hypothetical protein